MSCSSQAYNSLAKHASYSHLCRKYFAEEESFHFEQWLRESTVVPIVAIQSGERLQRDMIYVTPPGQSVFLTGRTLNV